MTDLPYDLLIPFLPVVLRQCCEVLETSGHSNQLNFLIHKVMEETLFCDDIGEQTDGRIAGFLWFSCEEGDKAFIDGRGPESTNVRDLIVKEKQHGRLRRDKRLTVSTNEQADF